jgi:putative spermidine/putrescine transport system permease protein
MGPEDVGADLVKLRKVPVALLAPWLRVIKTGLVLVIPVVLFDLLFLIAPLVLMIQTSFANGLDSYREVVSYPLFTRSVANTVVISLVTTGIAIVLAYACAAAAWRAASTGRIVVFAFVLFPFWTGILVKNFAWEALLQDNGTINSVIQIVTHSQSPLPLLHNRFAVIVGMVHYVLPYAFFPIYLALTSIDRRLETAAMSLGASRLRIITSVVLPLSLPGVYVASLLVLIICTGFFITPILLGGPGDIMVSNLVDFYANRLVEFSSASALALLIMVSVGVLVVVYQRLPKEGQYGIL